MSKDALRQLHSKGVISSNSWVWAAGLQAPQQLCRVRELRWMLSTGLGLLGPFDAALVALQVSHVRWLNKAWVLTLHTPVRDWTRKSSF
jgi:hypothetical protein